MPSGHCASAPHDSGSGKLHEYLAEGRDRLGKFLKLNTATAAVKPRMRALFAAAVLTGEQGD